MSVRRREEASAVNEPGVRTQTGRAAAVTELYLAHHRRLVGLASVLVDDLAAAEEVVQDAFLTFYRRGRLLRDRSAAVAHLTQFVVDDGRRHLRRRRSGSPSMREWDAPPAMLVPLRAGRTAVVDQDLDGMWQAICSLPRRQREVVVLRHYVDQTDSEIAASLGTSRTSVGTHARRALSSLARSQRLARRTPVELLVAQALADHAEEAMSRTDTQAGLRDVLSLGAGVNQDRRRRWAIGGLVTAALVVPGATAWPTGNQSDVTLDPHVPIRSIRPMNAEEQLAHDFVSAYFGYDRRLAASYVVHGLVPGLRRDLGEKGWLRQNRLEQALHTEFHLDGCFQIATMNPDGVRVGCLYTVNILGLGEVGHGPFSGNLFAVAVDEGRVTDFVTAMGANDYDEEAWGPFWAWVEDTHASELPSLEAMDDPDLDAREVTRTIRAWRQVGRAYGEALRSGKVP
jgi:RNA polymerase sigma factor (sigma-70 family)